MAREIKSKQVSVVLRSKRRKCVKEDGVITVSKADRPRKLWCNDSDLTWGHYDVHQKKKKKSVEGEGNCLIFLIYVVKLTYLETFFFPQLVVN